MVVLQLLLVHTAGHHVSQYLSLRLLLWLMAHFGAGHHVSQYLRLRLPGILGRRLAELGDAREAMSQGKHTP